MPEIEFDVECNESGHGTLSATYVSRKCPENGTLYVEPCEECLANEYEKGKAEAKG